MGLRKRPIERGSERAVSPVIGVIMMVAITIILAAVIGTFVLGMSDEMADTPPRLSTVITDHDDTYAPNGYLFRIRVNSISEYVEQGELTIRVSDADDGNRLAVLEEDSPNAFEDTNAKLLKNGKVGSNIAATGVVRSGDVLIVQDDGGPFSAGDEYRIEVVYQAEQDPEIIAEGTVTLR